MGNFFSSKPHFNISCRKVTFFREVKAGKAWKSLVAKMRQSYYENVKIFQLFIVLLFATLLEYSLQIFLWR